MLREAWRAQQIHASYKRTIVHMYVCLYVCSCHSCPQLALSTHMLCCYFWLSFGILNHKLWHFACEPNKLAYKTNWYLIHAMPTHTHTQQPTYTYAQKHSGSLHKYKINICTVNKQAGEQTNECTCGQRLSSTAHTLTLTNRHTHTHTNTYTCEFMWQRIVVLSSLPFAHELAITQPAYAAAMAKAGSNTYSSIF